MIFAVARAREIYNISIETNDLTQFLLAVDRSYSRVAGLYDTLHPAVSDAVDRLSETSAVLPRRSACVAKWRTTRRVLGGKVIESFPEPAPPPEPGRATS